MTLKKIRNDGPQILSDTVHNLVATAAWRQYLCTPAARRPCVFWLLSLALYTYPNIKCQRQLK
jgi:hypothetical protein